LQPLKTMNRPLLSAALIAKNEENFIGECLNSLKGVADEVVVVDTGSTDRTKDIARSASAQVYDYTWNGDFSAARNRALEWSTGEWILYIDADERVRANTGSNLRAELSAPSFAGHRVLLHPLKGHTSYWSLRLFRNDPSIRFTGIIHESTWPSLQEYCFRSGTGVGHSRMVIDHEGYEKNHDAKNARNLPLLLKSLEEEPERVYSWCHLANIYMAMQKQELAEDAWRNALAVVRKKGAQAPEDILPYLGLIETGMNAGRNIRPLFAEAVTRFPRNVQLEWLEGGILMREGNFTGAITAFERLTARGRSGEIDHLAAYDLRLFGAFAHDAMGICHLRLGNYAESRRCYELAAQQEPDQLKYRVKRALCSHLQLRETGARASC
jgi:glycosyltransferase involved in cell wall biosynthesis